MSRLACLTLSLAPLAIGTLAACETTGSDKGAATGTTVDQAAAEVGNCITHLDATLASLKEMVEKPAPDLTTQYKTYTSNLKSLESSATKVKELATQMDLKSQQYFSTWDTQIADIQNEDIRERSVERRKTIEANFNKIKAEYTEVRAEFKPLLSDLQDVRTVLSNDLTMDGLKSIDKTVKNVAGKSEDVRESLEELEKRFRDLGVKLSRTGPPAEPVPPAK
jgi:DNA repair exonuclease SbcCD ATPase subunit